MASITIRNLYESLKSRLRVRAAVRGHCMEEEAREILRTALRVAPSTQSDLGSAIHALFKPLGGVDLTLASREPMRDPPDFGS